MSAIQELGRNGAGRDLYSVNGETLLYLPPESPHRVFFVSPRLGPIVEDLSDTSHEALANRINFIQLPDMPSQDGSIGYGVWDFPYILDFASGELARVAHQWENLAAQGLSDDEITARIRGELTPDGMRERFRKFASTNKDRMLAEVLGS